MTLGGYKVAVFDACQPNSEEFRHDSKSIYGAMDRGSESSRSLPLQLYFYVFEDEQLADVPKQLLARTQKHT